MPSTRRAERIYNELLALYTKKGFRNPKLSLNYDIERQRREGKSREEAIKTLYREVEKQIHLQAEDTLLAERRLKELESELNELRTSLRNRAEEMESIKKYLAYTHRLTTSQVIARVFFYFLGAVLIIMSFFQYHALTTYIRAASGFGWVFILDCIVTLSLGISAIALGWVLESMARSRPVF